MYKNRIQIICLDEIEDYLTFISEIFLKPSTWNADKNERVNENKSQINQDALIQKYHELELEFNKNKNNLFNEMNSFATSLKENGLFYDEYFDFCEIQDIIMYTLNREFSSIKSSDFEFILGLVIEFSKIINYKIDLIEKNNFNDEFESEYMNYLTNFTKSKNYFYENICDDEIDDDLFIEYTNIIMEL